MPNADQGKLTGQAAIVTGAGRGIGRAVALRLMREGAAVAIADIAIERARQTVSAIEESGGRAIALSVDTASRSSVDAMVASAAEAFGRIDILVNNAAIARSAPFLDQSAEDWADHIGINLSGVFHCSQAAARVMATAGYGRIISITSIAGMMGPLDFPAYGAAKAGVIGLTRAMALELADHGITANAIAPGPIDTELLREAWSPAAYSARAQHIPVARLGQADEIAYAVLMLAAPEAAYITGVVLPVDGGAAAAGSYMSEKFRRRSVEAPG
ncbi:SDR family NAD(P)-dependent oxidoreductase [Flavisphingomonas formosensis]|uniref:SDR family NAD(P)-dependent oxidoreductase n=1 Tax=Flavisphingomonas formosensis TaxID=861534 RepID=UPI0012F92281|nr:3-oxoacyl-ACP reductase family protein [Sphingomonas formosensis]